MAQIKKHGNKKVWKYFCVFGGNSPSRISEHALMDYCNYWE